MEAAIDIDVKTHIGRVPPQIYGIMFENAGKCVYDGLWVGPASPIPNRQGIRKDMLEKLHALNPKIIRWPGGTPSLDSHGDGLA